MKRPGFPKKLLFLGSVNSKSTFFWTYFLFSKHFIIDLLKTDFLEL